MRVCPTCRTRYTDDTLRYCLQDGATLVGQLESDTPTVAFKGQETVEASRHTTARSECASWQEEELTRVATKQPGSGRSGLLLAVIAVLVMMLVVVIAGAVGFWAYNWKTASNSNNASTNANDSLN